MGKIAKLIVATRNPAKKRRYSKILSGSKMIDKILSLDDFDLDNKPKESGETSEENARIKAIFYAKKIGLPVLAEDEALYVDFLPKDQQPGVHVRRVGDQELDDDELLAYWESIIASVPKGKRTGRWHITYCFATPDGKTALVALDHPIVFFSPSSKIRIPGWPMSSLEGPAELKKPHSELTNEEGKKHTQKTEELLRSKLKELLSKL